LAYSIVWFKAVSALARDSMEAKTRTQSKFLIAAWKPLPSSSPRRYFPGQANILHRDYAAFQGFAADIFDAGKADARQIEGHQESGNFA